MQLLEWRQPERISTVLHAEDAQQEAVHDKDDAAPSKHGNLLYLRVLYPWHIEGQGNGRE